jgi:hypothetical protein
VDEFSVNRLASMLDVDRQTMVRALKDTAADAGSEKKPLFRVSTAVAALDRHRGKPDRRRKQSDGGDVAFNRELERMFLRLDELRDKIEATPTVEGRLTLLRERFFSLVSETCRAMRADGESIGEDDVRLSLRVDAFERMQVITMRHLVGWNTDRVLFEYNRSLNPDDDEAVDPDTLIAELFKQSLNGDAA